MDFTQGVQVSRLSDEQEHVRVHHSLPPTADVHLCIHVCRHPRQDVTSTVPLRADPWPARQRQRQAYPRMHEAQAGQEWHHDLACALVLVQEAPCLRQLGIQIPSTSKLLQGRSCGSAGALSFSSERSMPAAGLLSVRSGVRSGG